MKRSILTTFLAILFGTLSLAQSPESFKYQAVVRDGAGAILYNQAVGLRMTILQGSASGTVVYQETFATTSNSVGLVNLSIGQGTIVAGTFGAIDWSAGPYFMETAMDATGGTSYTVMGASQLLSVPYALYATDVENDNDQQTINYNSSTGDLTISNGNTVTLPLSTGGDNWGSQVAQTDATLSGDGSGASPLSVVGDLTDDQNLSLATNVLSIDNGNSVDLSPYLDNTDAQTLSFAGTNLSISNGNTVDLASLQDGVNDADADPTNEYNSTLILSGTNLNLTDGGGTLTADLSSLQDGVNDADADPLNEIQTLSIAGSSLSISGGNTVTLPGGGNTLDMAYDQGGAGAGRTINVDAGEVEITTATSNGIGLRVTHSNTGVGILTSSTNAANTFSSIQATTNSSSNVAAAIIGNTDGAAWGVSGQASSTSTAQAAVYGSNLRTNGGHGVYGIGLNGVVGETNYSQGNAMWAENFDAIAPLGNGVGVAARGYWGVVGEDRYLGGVAGAYGVLANGELGATGLKSFIIDHPNDPENKFLKHFSTESNEVLNIYRGNVVLDADGEATVELPDYYGSINKNPSYHLTPIGDKADLYIKEEISENTFKIAGGSSGMRVSWTIYAERNDPYLVKYPEKRNVEVEKREGQKGKYFMPALYNASDDQRILPASGKTKAEQKPMNTEK